MADTDLIERAAKAIDLLPCPFCGGTPELMDTLPSGSYWYRCEECCGETEGGKTHAEAIAAWNRRASPQPANPAQVTDAVAICRTAAEEMIAANQQWRIDPRYIITICEALTAAIGAGGQAVAWMRKWAFDGIDVMAMPKKERPAGWMLHEVTRHQCLPDDAPLYAHPVQPGWRGPDGFTPYLWQCKDYADGWISYADKEEALAYQRDTGCLLRTTYRPVAPQPKGE